MATTRKQATRKGFRLVVGQIRRHPTYGLIYITGGTYESNGRVSNSWNFRRVLKDGSLSARELVDYGDPHWPIPESLEPKIRIVRKKRRVSAANFKVISPKRRSNLLVEGELP